MINLLKRLLYVATFLILAKNSSKAQSWKYLGNESQIAAAASSYTSIAVADVEKDSVSYVSVPHVAFTESGIAKVKRYLNGAWEPIGGNVSDGAASYTNLFADDQGKLYLNYVDVANGNKLAIKTFNEGLGVWQPLGGNVNNIYLSSGSIINNINSGYSSSRNSWMAFDANNIPFVIFTDFTNASVNVKKFDGTNWVQVGTGAVSTEKGAGVGIAFNPSTDLPYVAYTYGTGSTGTLRVYTLANNAWSPVVIPTTDVIFNSNPYPSINGAVAGSITGIRHTSIAFDSENNLNIAYFNFANGSKATVIKYNPVSTTWSVSGTLSNRDVYFVSLIKGGNGNLYASFIDGYSSTSRNIARVRELVAGSSSWTELIDSTAAVGVTEPASNIWIAVSSMGTKYISYTATNSSAVVTPVVRYYYKYIAPPVIPVPDVVVNSPKQMEYLNRGVVASKINTSQVLVSWRLLGTDPSNISFNVYSKGVKLNSTPITSSTNYLDNSNSNIVYTIKSIINGVEKEEGSAGVWANNFLRIPLQQPPGGTTPDQVSYTYTANDASVGDVDGDGTYEIFLKWQPTNESDNSGTHPTGNTIIDCYKLDGTRLWRIDLGINIVSGPHYTQFMVYDFDGDGKAEMACKTADGSIDGTGTVIGNATADYRDQYGRVLTGPEFLTMFNGLTGRAMSTVNYLPARGTVSAWGDSYGNRVDRFIAAVAYLDGQKPSLIMGRGYYTRLVRVAWDFVNGNLQHRWTFDSNLNNNGGYSSMGNHQMSVADVDGDGKQEIFNGSSAINDNGNGLWTDGKGHGDALHITDMDPSTPELEEWMCHESPSQYSPYGLRFKNAKTGETIWGITTTGDVGRAMAADIDPNYLGYEVWGSSGGNVYTNKGVSISTNVPTYNFGIWWDGDLCRELLDKNVIDKWNPSTKASGRLYTIYQAAPVTSNNSTKGTPCLSADILGDWREEVILRASDNQSLYLFTTQYVTERRIYTLMHDPQYRVAIAWQNSAYNQPPYPSFYLGTDMAPAPTPNIYTVGGETLPINLINFKAKVNSDKVLLNWSTASEANNKLFTIERSSDGVNFFAIANVNGAGNSKSILNYSITDYNPLIGISYYRLRQTDVDGASTFSNTQAINLQLKDDELHISPNPVVSQLKLDLPSTNTNLILSLHAMDGRLQFQTSGSLQEVNNLLNVHLVKLPSGIYSLRIKDYDKVYTQKLIKQ